MKHNLLSMILTMLMVLGLGLMSNLLPTAQAADTVSTEAQLQQAVQNGNDITLTADITLSSAVTISGKTITIDGGGHSVTLLSDGYRHFDVSNSSELTLKNITIQGIADSTGGGIQVRYSTLTLEQSTLTTNSNESGGGMYAYYSTVNLISSAIENCTATTYNGSGMCVSASEVSIIDSTIKNCTANSSGGGIYALSNSMVSLMDSAIENCAANTYYGGGVYVSNCAISISKSTIESCTSKYTGGGVYISSNYNTDISESTIKNCSSMYAGGVFVSKSTVNLADSTIEGCIAERMGGGIYTTETDLNLIDSKITSCMASIGGGIRIADSTTMSITGSTIANCTADTGGGMYTTDSEVNFTDSDITKCTAGSGGGVTASHSTVNLISNAIENCAATYNGGGVYACYNSTLSLKDSEITNCTSNDGSGVYASASSVSLADSSTIASCTASRYGGGVYASSDSNITSDETTNYSGNKDIIVYKLIDHDDIKYACLSIITSYDTNGSPIYSGSLNGYDIYWESYMTPSYTIYFDSNGGTAVTSQTVNKGSCAEEPAAPAKEGYTFTGWYTDKELTKEYSFNSSVTYSFTLYAGWQANVITHEPYIEGYADKTFKPTSPVSRAEVAQMLYNISGEKADGTSKFPDVDSGAWYHDAVTYLSDRGIISGYPDGTFEPDSKISRAELVKMVVIYAQLTGNSEIGNSFPDVPSDHWAAWYLSTAKDAGYINGYVDGNFHPEQHITRAETVKILNAMLGRTIENSVLDGLTMPFADVEASYWAYNEILEASVKHEH